METQNALQKAAIREAAADTACALLGSWWPIFGTAYTAINSVSDVILKSKLEHILTSRPDIQGWLKCAPLFQKNHPQYQKNVENLIYSIDAIREQESLDIYANLLSAWQQELIDRDMFFRLVWCVSQIYSADLKVLESLYKRKKKLSGVSMQVLYNNGLLAGRSYAFTGAGTSIEVWLSASGLAMLRCGLKLDNYSDFPDFDPNEISRAFSDV